MKLWLDDMRPAPKEYDYIAGSVDAAKMMIKSAEEIGEPIELLDLDHDLGDNAAYGGDGIKLLDWLVERKTFYPIKLHTANPVGRANMQRLIDRYWTKQTKHIKNCPFCGHKATIIPFNPDYGTVTIGCTNEDCDITMGKGFFSEDDAIKHWNRRFEITMDKIQLKDAIVLYDKGHMTLEGVYDACETDLEFYNFLKNHLDKDDNDIKDAMKNTTGANDAYYNALSMID